MKKVKIVNKETTNSDVELTGFQLLEKIKEEGAIEMLHMVYPRVPAPLDVVVIKDVLDLVVEFR